jgi:hypothetical protein
VFVVVSITVTLVLPTLATEARVDRRIHLRPGKAPTGWRRRRRVLAVVSITVTLLLAVLAT